MIYMGRLCPEVQPLTLLYTIFHKRGTPFMYLPLINGTPFTYLVQNFASLLTAVKTLSFKYESVTFPRLCKAIKFICSALWALSLTEMTDFPTLSYISTSENVTRLSYGSTCTRSRLLPASIQSGSLIYLKPENKQGQLTTVSSQSTFRSLEMHFQ